MPYHEVMRKPKQSNEIEQHNVTITPSPVILLFNAGAQAGAHAEFLGEILGAKLVRVRRFTPEYLVPGTPEHRQMEAATTEADRATLRAISLLRYADSESESDTTAKALRDAAMILLPGHPAREEFVTSKLYSSLLTRGMNGAKLVMWRSSEGTVPAILCPSLKVAMFVASAFKAIAACSNCQKLFALDAERLDGSASEKYCSVACGMRFRQRMYRLRQKSKSKRKGNKHEKG
jgi:hypothetical protein